MWRNIDMNQFLCINCAKNEELKNLIISKEQKGLCALCKKQDVSAINCTDKELQNLFKSLIRFYYSEWEYNPHLGGEDIRSFFDKENLLLNDWMPSGTDDGDDLWNVVEEIVGFEDNDEVSIYSEYNLTAIKNDYCMKISYLESQLQKRNHYEIELEAVKILKDIIADTDKIILNGANYYRARNGYLKSGVSSVPYWQPEKHFMPFKANEIGNPPPPCALNGRMNRQGVSFLYLASNLYTAVAEIRPYPGQYISTGKFVSNADIKVVDLTNIRINNYSSDKKLGKLLTLKTINDLFSRPVPNQAGGQYLITQLLAEVIRKLGYDGVVYQSYVGSGTNLVIFNPLLFDYTEEEAGVVYIKEVNYSYDLCQIMCSKEYSYTYDVNGNLMK